MFCPKCGSQDSDTTTFCRTCGAQLSGVLKVIDGKMPELSQQLLTEHNNLLSTGIRNVVLGFGFLLISFLLLMMPGNTLFWLLMMVPGICLLASGVSRIVKASGSKSITSDTAFKSNSIPPASMNAPLPPSRTAYISPDISQYQTDSFQQPSVTDPTTKLLEKHIKEE